MRPLGTAGAPLAKAEPLSRSKARAARAHAAARRRCLLTVYAREGMRCQVCGRALVLPFSTDQALVWAQGHEIVPRARGGSDTDASNVLLVDAHCHNQITLGNILVSGSGSQPVIVRRENSA